MSLMKRYVEDVQDVQEAALRAAQQSTSRARFAAITETFARCGMHARKYHHPQAVAQTLVRQAVDTYHAARRSAALEAAA
ncbi:hypothetical protein AB0I84_07390 [Streptomyces spectabilis]|uniref:hypothetical protein n=1 Tax=Streptomyces spectabilis TaxID=68270 RepID=UPI0033D9B21B